jgi:hypothetical protein
VQVSRLGAPLVNEVVIGLGDKDKFNATKPTGDTAFLNYVTNPTLPVLFNALYGIPLAPTPRNDLVAVFLTGVAGLNKPANPNQVPCEMLRLNLAIAPAARPNRFGVIAGDVAGFPNGRRLADDVVDIEERVAAGVLVPGFNNAPANQLGDGVDANDLPYLPYFPYVALPHNPLNNQNDVLTKGAARPRSPTCSASDPGDQNETRRRGRADQAALGSAVQLEPRARLRGAEDRARDAQGLRGERAAVRTLVDQDAAAGNFRATWDGRDDGGARSARGVYFARYDGRRGGRRSQADPRVTGRLEERSASAADPGRQVRVRRRPWAAARGPESCAYATPFPDLLATRAGRLFTFFMLYMTEGIPLGFTATAIGTQMRRQGLTPAAIGLFVGSLYLPWAFKWIAGPFVDTITSDRLGRRRTWILCMQIGMIATLLIAWPINFVSQLSLFTAIIFIHNAFCATQDVAIDALAVNVCARTSAAPRTLHVRRRVDRAARGRLARAPARQRHALPDDLLLRGRHDRAGDDRHRAAAARPKGEPRPKVLGGALEAIGKELKAFLGTRGPRSPARAARRSASCTRSCPRARTRSDSRCSRTWRSSWA